MFFDLIIAFIYVGNLFDANMSLIILFVGLSYTYLGTKIAVWTVKKRRRFNKAWVSLNLSYLTYTSDTFCMIANRVKNSE